MLSRSCVITTEVSQLFSKAAPRFKSRKGGYTRIIPYIQRGGDNAELAFLELTEKSREIITNLKRVKAVKEAGDVKTVSEAAETKPVAPNGNAKRDGSANDTFQG